MKKRASMKQEMQSSTAEIGGEVISEKDRAISLYIEWLTLGIDEIEKLLDRIQKDGLTRVSVGEFYPSLENLGRECFISWVEDIEGRCFATPKFANAYHKQYLRYACKVDELTRAIKERSPNSQQAQQLAAAIDRLHNEVRGAIERGTSQYILGKGKPQPADLLSDTRHGALCDSVENAIVALSTAQAEMPLSNVEICAAIRAEVRKLKNKRDAKEMTRKQRERAADWLKAENAAGRKASIVDAARQFGNEIQAEKIKGGYVDVASLCTALNRCAVKLDIAQFKDTKRGRPRKR